MHKVFASLTATTPTIFADLRTDVYDFWDRGLLGLELHPNFPATPYVYVLYALDRAQVDWLPRGSMSDVAEVRWLPHGRQRSRVLCPERRAGCWRGAPNSNASIWTGPQLRTKPTGHRARTPPTGSRSSDLKTAA